MNQDNYPKINIEKTTNEKGQPLTNEQGTCPNCQSLELDYGVAEFEDNMIYYPWECTQCNLKGEEWYSLEFAGHNINIDGDSHHQLSL